MTTYVYKKKVGLGVSLKIVGLFCLIGVMAHVVIICFLRINADMIASSLSCLTAINLLVYL